MAWEHQRSRYLADRQAQSDGLRFGCSVIGGAALLVTAALVAGSIYEGRPPTFVENFGNWFYHNIWDTSAK